MCVYVCVCDDECVSVYVCEGWSVEGGSRHLAQCPSCG